MNFSISTSEAPQTRRATTRSQSRARRYLAKMGVVTGAVLGLSALLVWTVDPYGELGRNTIGIYAESERSAKPAMLHAAKADTVLIGSSKVSFIDPRVLGPSAFNAAFAAAMPEEIVNFVRHHVPPGSRVVVGLDAFMMNAHAYPLAGDTFAKPPSMTQSLSYLFGLRPAWASVTAMIAHARGQPRTLTTLGQRDLEIPMARHEAMTQPDHAQWLHSLRTHQFAAFAYSAQRVAALRDLYRLTVERDITLHVFINPLSNPVRDLIASLPAASDVARFRADVQEIFPGAVDLSMAPHLGDLDLYFRFDPFHYLPSTGETVMREVMAHPPVFTPHEPHTDQPPLGVVRGDDYPMPLFGLTLNDAKHGAAD